MVADNKNIVTIGVESVVWLASLGIVIAHKKIQWGFVEFIAWLVFIIIPVIIIINMVKGKKK